MIPLFAARTRPLLGSSDYPFWYNERANMGSIAAAAWLADGVALEEYSAPKGESRGRADLWILLDGKQFAFEAKQAWPSIGARARKRPSQDCREWLEAAKRDARELSESEGTPVGLVFVTPSLPGAEVDRLDSHLRNFLDEIGRKGFGMAWWFDPEHPAEDPDDGRLYPGALILCSRA